MFDEFCVWRALQLLEEKKNKQNNNNKPQTPSFNFDASLRFGLEGKPIRYI